MASRPIADNLFTTDDPPRLIGGRHKSTAKVVFPLPEGNEARSYERIFLPHTGTVWSHTIQRFRPKSPPYVGPAEFTPYAVAYVELADHIIVESLIVDAAWNELHIGMAVELTRVPYGVDDDGTPTLTYAFRPASVAPA